MAAEQEREQSSADRIVSAMRESAARLNGIILSAMDAIITINERHEIVIFNPAAELMFGCTAGDVRGTPLERFIPVRVRDTHRTHIQRFAETGVTTRRMGTQSAIVGLRTNGEEFPLEASISQVSVGGKKLLTVILRDITARKRAEDTLRESAERYQRLVELVPDAIWIERDNRIVFLNRACVQLLGGDSVVRVLNRPPLDFIHPDFHAVAAVRRERLASALETTPLMEKRIVRLDGEVRDVEIAEAAFHDEGSVAFLAVLRDVTDRKASERQLRESREQLRHLSAALQEVREEEKTRIARELHDELGQALTGLKMDLARLVGQLTPEQRGAREQADAMKALIDNTVTSVRRIATELRPLMLDDLGLVPTVEWLVNDFTKRSGIPVDLDMPQRELEVDARVCTAIFRVLQEALTNVARHAEASRVHIELMSSGDKIQLVVSDNGKGISVARQDAPKTFGLLGMRERAAMLGGDLTVDSDPGAGTCVIMIVPRLLGTNGGNP